LRFALYGASITESDAELLEGSTLRRAFPGLILAICLALPCVRVAQAGPVLDRILNNMVLDASNDGPDRRNYKTIEPGGYIGQTFTTGPNIVEVSRIAVAICPWHESWTKDEQVVMTLWDSPAKVRALASAEMRFEWRDWEGQVVMFTLNAPVAPNTEYYFELTVKGGDGRIVGVYHGGNYKGQAYVDGKKVDANIWFQIHSRRAFDRDKEYADRFSQWNLDYPGLEKIKAAVLAKDWDKAVDELIIYYESRPDLVDPKDVPNKKPDYDPSYDNLVLDKKIKDANGEIVDLGPNWNHFRSWPTRGGVGLTRSGILKNFRSGYINSGGDEKYAIGFNEMMTNLLNDIPSPLRAGYLEPGKKGRNAAPPPGIAGGSMWSGLSIGARMNQMWYFYSGFHTSKNFTRDIRAAMIFNMVDMAEVLALLKGGGNWDAQMSTALYELADRHPELAKSNEWFEQGLSAMFENLWTICYPDGVVQEPTFNYNNIVVNRYRKLLDTCKARKIAVDPKYVKRVEKAVEYIMYSTQPDWQLPSRGDTFNFTDGREICEWGANYFGRDDMLWVGSRGKKGRPPLATSAQFPIGKWFVMRSDWGSDALYLNLHNGKDRGHGHADQNSITINAYGHKLVVDPGCYIYGTPYQRELYNSRMHATVTVDDRNTITEDGVVHWYCGSSVDYYCGTNAGYERLDGVKHTRRILFVKPGKKHGAASTGYWLTYDVVTGSGEHDVTAWFPFYVGKHTFDKATCVFRTLNRRGNLIVVPCAADAMTAADYKYDFPDNGLNPAPGVKYSKKTTLPISFATLLLPYPGMDAPSVKFEKLCENGYRVTTLHSTDYIFFGSGAAGGVEFKGDALLLRTSGTRVVDVAQVNGVSLRWNGKTLATN